MWYGLENIKFGNILMSRKLRINKVCEEIFDHYLNTLQGKDSRLRKYINFVSSDIIYREEFINDISLKKDKDIILLKYTTNVRLANENIIHRFSYNPYKEELIWKATYTNKHKVIELVVKKVSIGNLYSTLISVEKEEVLYDLLAYDAVMS